MPLPTPANVIPLISLSWPIERPPCHTLTYLITPESSAASEPPYGCPVTPSTKLTPPVVEIGALPNIINPPQLPLGLAANSSGVNAEVNVIGASAVPSAIIVEPCVNTKAGAKPVPSSDNDFTVVPASKVTVTPDWTNVWHVNNQSVAASNVVSVSIVPHISSVKTKEKNAIIKIINFFILIFLSVYLKIWLIKKSLAYFKLSIFVFYWMINRIKFERN